jgi:hypothetical protein
MPKIAQILAPTGTCRFSVESAGPRFFLGKVREKVYRPKKGGENHLEWQRLLFFSFLQKECARRVDVHE